MRCRSEQRAIRQRTLVPVTAVLLLGSVFGTVRAGEMRFIEVDPGRTTCLRERETGGPFVAVGVNYFDHETGWAPRLWQKFDEQRVTHQLDLLKQQGMNTIRVFMTLTSMHSKPGEVDEAGAAKLRKLLDLCRERIIYVIPSGADYWEGAPEWRKGDRFADEATLAADERWWTAVGRLFKDDPAILAWDLVNEPAIGWDNPAMRAAWNRWLDREYRTVAEIAKAWGRPAEQVGKPGEIAVPPAESSPGDRRLLDYQRFREHLADEWTRRMAAAVRAGDPNHLVTVGHVQWVSPLIVPTIWHYAGFDMRVNARHVDFVTIHFYPLGTPRPCDGPGGIRSNAEELEALLATCSVGKPVMLGEFGWYGGGPIMQRGKEIMPPQTPADQLAWNNRLLEVTRGRVCGWLNWAMADTATSTDLTRWSGLFTQDLQLKPWGKAYGEFAREATRRPEPARPLPAYLLNPPWDKASLVTSLEKGAEARVLLHKLAASRPSDPRQ